MAPNSDTNGKFLMEPTLYSRKDSNTLRRFSEDVNEKGTVAAVEAVLRLEWSTLTTELSCRWTRSLWWEKEAKDYTCQFSTVTHFFCCGTTGRYQESWEVLILPQTLSASTQMLEMRLL